MYKLILGFVMSSLIACNNSGGGGGGSSPTKTQEWNSFVVAAEGDLPTCSGDIIGRLYYLETTNSFKVCKSTGWTAIDVKGDAGANGTNGTNGTNGFSITSIKDISYSSTNFCTQFSSTDTCKFGGGQIVILSDGSFIINFKWTYFSAPSYTDIDVTNVTEVYPSSYNTGVSIAIHPFVARGAGYNVAYINVGTSPTPFLHLWLDTNGNGSFDAGTDEIFYTPTLSDF